MRPLHTGHDKVAMHVAQSQIALAAGMAALWVLGLGLAAMLILR